MPEIARTPYSAVWLDPRRVAWFDRQEAPVPDEPDEPASDGSAPASAVSASDGEAAPETAEEPAAAPEDGEPAPSRTAKRPAAIVQVVVRQRDDDLIERFDLPSERGVGPVALLGAGPSLVALMSTSFSGEPHPIYRVDPTGLIKRIGQVPSPPRSAVVLGDAVLVLCYEIGHAAKLWRVPLAGGHARELGTTSPGLQASLVTLDDVAYTVVDGRLHRTDGTLPLTPVPGSPGPLGVDLFSVEGTLVVSTTDGLCQYLPQGASRPLPHTPAFPRAVATTEAGWLWMERGGTELERPTPDRIRRFSADGSEGVVWRSFDRRVGAAMMSGTQVLMSLQEGESLFAPDYAIIIDDLPTERPQRAQPVEPETSPLSEAAELARTEQLTTAFGKPHDTLPPTPAISGAWPMGSFLRFRGKRSFEGRFATVTSGLSHPDLPRAGVGVDLAASPVLAGRAGYGIELAIITGDAVDWAVEALAALVRAQLRNRFLYLDVLERYGCALETRIPLPDGSTINLALSRALTATPPGLTLPNGTADLVMAVVVPEPLLANIERVGPSAVLAFLDRRGPDLCTER